MGNVIVELLPLIAGAGLVPLYIILVLLLLQNEDGVLKASMFVAGGITVRIVQGILFGYVFGSSAEAGSSSDGSGLIVSTLLTVVGILLLVTAFKQWRKEEDPDAPPPQWMTAMSELTPLKAFGIGVGILTIAAKQWIFTLSAIGLISESSLGPAANLGLFLFYVLAAASLLIAPILIYVLLPSQSARILTTSQEWLETHNRVIVIVMSLIFGLLFLYKGITGIVV